MEAVELEFSFLVKRVHCEYLQIANEKRVELVKELNRESPLGVAFEPL